MKKISIITIIFLISISIIAQDNEPDFNQGVDLYKAKKFQSAIESFSKVIENNKNNYNAYIYRAICNMNICNYDKAHEDVDKAINNGYKLEWAYNTKGLICQNQYKYETSITYFDKAIEISNKYFTAISNKAYSLYNMKRYSESETLLKSILELNSTYYGAYTGQAYIAEDNRDYNKALDIYKFILEKDKINKTVLYHSAKVNIELMNLYEASGYLDQLYELDKEYSDYYNAKAMIYLINDDYENAKLEYEKILTFNERAYRTFIRLAFISRVQKNYDLAKEYFKKAYIINDDYYFYYIERSFFYYQLDNLENSLADIKTAANLNKYNCYVKFLNIFFALQVSDSELKNALSLLKKDRMLFVENNWQTSLIDFYLNKVKSTEQLKEELLKEAQDLRQNLCEAYFYIGTKYLINGDKNSAKEYFQKCLETKTKNYIEYQLAEIYLGKN